MVSRVRLGSALGPRPLPSRHRRPSRRGTARLPNRPLFCPSLFAKTDPSSVSRQSPIMVFRGTLRLPRSTASSSPAAAGPARPWASARVRPVGCSTTATVRRACVSLFFLTLSFSQGGPGCHAARIFSSSFLRRVAFELHRLTRFKTSLAALCRSDPFRTQSSLDCLPSRTQQRLPPG